MTPGSVTSSLQRSPEPLSRANFDQLFPFAGWHNRGPVRPMV